MGRSTTELTTEKMAVVAPVPNASVMMVTSATVGALRKRRNAYRTSERKLTHRRSLRAPRLRRFWRRCCRFRLPRAHVPERICAHVLEIDAGRDHGVGQ